jgi:ATP-dependent Lon protease
VRSAPVRGVTADSEVEVEARMRSLKSVFDEYLALNPRLAKDVVFAIVSSDDPLFLSEYIPANLLFRYEDKQAVMNENTLIGRLEKLLDMLRRECQVMRIEKEIAEKVNESMDKNQRDYYLHEQLHVISDELGEGEDTHAEADEYRSRIQALGLAPDSEAKLLKEVTRLAKMQGSNQEATVIRTYLDTCLDLPWNTFTEDDLDINRAAQMLDREHYGLTKVKDRILEMLAVRALSPDLKAQIICLVGPPGVGKTSIAHSIAEALGRKYVRLSLGGVRDEAEIRGHRRTYIGAMPGKIISAMITAGTQNPLILLDEVDKLANDSRGDPAAALLEALDPEQNNTFKDHFLDIPYDLSHVLFVTTANDLGGIPEPLRDRMDIIELPSYTRVEKYNIARRHLLPKQLKNCGLTGKVSFSQSALYGLIDGYTREAGVRNLERTINAVLRKCARKIAAGEVESVAVTNAMLEDLLGPRRNVPEFLNRTNAVGIANGLAWTAVGGETLPIEVQVIDNGSGKITLTGSLGDVMKESAQLALTYARVHAAEYGIDPERLKKCDLHIHAPEGAVPKDGPSAGVTLTTALISCLSDLPVRGDVAMTGEITLHGNVLPIGGLREKSMAAYRENIKTVLIPKGNESNLYDVDEEVKKSIRFVPVSTVAQVLNEALIKPKAAAAPRTRSRKARTGEPALLPQADKQPKPEAIC